MKHRAYEHAAEVAHLHLDRETALKVAHDEFRHIEEHLMCVCVSLFRRASCVCAL